MRASGTGRLHGAAKVFVNIVAILGGLVAVAVIVCVVSGIRPLVFLSGSMSPTIGTGALAVTVPVDGDEIRPGDIISVVRGDGMRVTHRAVAVSVEDGRTLLEMKGDANLSTDGELYDVTAGADKVVWHIEGLGYLMTGPKLPWYLAAVALLIIVLWPGKKKDAAQEAPAGDEPAAIDPLIASIVSGPGADIDVDDTTRRSMRETRDGGR